MATNMNILNSAAQGGGSYQQFLQKLAAGGGLEAQEAQALLSGGMQSGGGQFKNTVANALVNIGGGLTGNYGLAQPLGYDQYGQVKGGYGPQGLTNLNSIYQQAWQSAQNDGGGSTVSGGGYGGSGPVIDRNQVALYDNAISDLNNNLGRLDNQKNIAFGNIGDQYTKNLNQLKSAFNNAQTSYKNSSTQNSQSLRTNNNNIDDKASAGLRSMSRLLGAYGAGGSSDMFNASDAVTRTATGERNGANQTFAENQRGLDTNWNVFKSEDEGRRKDLDGWQTNQRRAIEQDIETNRQSLLQQLASAQSSRASYMGGNAGAAGQQYRDQANALSGKIDSLGRTVQGWDGTTPVYQQRELSSYATPTDTKMGTSGLPGVANSTLVNTLFKDDDKEKKLY